MSISYDKLNELLSAISIEYKIDMDSLVGSLDKMNLIPKKKSNKDNTTQQKVFDNKRAKEFAEANNISVDGIIGTGRGGLITIKDIKIHQSQGKLVYKKVTDKVTDKLTDKVTDEYTDSDRELFLELFGSDGEEEVPIIED
jgi:pyruvate/2-oxoglutarate dehydrogenase complex dihydrolipoamide acyltransferase (E2) component